MKKFLLVVLCTVVLMFDVLDGNAAILEKPFVSITGIYAKRNGMTKSSKKIMTKNISKFGNITKNEFVALCREGSAQNVIAALKRRGISLNFKFQDGTNLLGCAAGVANADIIRTLISKGVKVDVMSQNGTTPLMEAALMNSNPDVIKAIISAGAKVNSQNNQGATPLICAAENNSNPDVIKLLIDSGADVNYQQKPWGGRTVLMASVENPTSSNKIIKVLIDSGAKIDVQDKDGDTALLRAVMREYPNIEVIRTLINAGANPTIRNKQGLCAIDFEDVEMIWRENIKNFH